MPSPIQRLLDNPVALVGVLRALAIAAMTWGVSWLTDDKVDAALNFLAIALPFLSLLFTGASAKAHSSEVREALNTPAPAVDTTVDYQ